jgi:HK97 family phage portal protein
MIRRSLNTVRRFAGGLAYRAASILGMSPEIYGATSSRSIATSLAGVSVNNDTALKVSAYKRGVELIANYIGKTPFHVKADRRKVKNHPAWKLVRKWAQYHQLSAFDFRRTLILLALTRGNGYAYIVRDQSATPTELRILDPGLVTPTLLKGSLFYRFAGRESLIPAVDVIHIKGISKDGFIGLDPIKTYAADVLGLSLAQMQYASTYYAAGGSPSVYVYSQNPLDDDRYNRLKGATGPLKRSLDNPHEIPVLDAAELRTLNLSAEQTQLLGSREFSLKDIANILNLTVHKLNGEGTGGYKSVEEENNAFRDDTLDPWFVQFEIQYEKLLTEAEQESESHTVEAVRESLTRSNMTDRANYLTKAVGGPWMTPGEARDVDSLEDLENTGELYPPPNMTKEDPAATEPAAAPADKPKRSDTLQQVAALEDTFSRMVKRVTVAARKAAEKPEGFPAFLQELEAKHGDVIRSAFGPLVALCGGESRHADAIAAALLAEARTKLEPGGGVPEVCDQLERSVGRFARKAVELWN